MKICTKCGIKNSKSEFYKDKRATDGLYSHCKSCANKNAKKWQASPVGQIYKKHWWDSAGKVYMKNRRATSDGKISRRREGLKYRYGITLEDYDKLLESQGGVCAICGTDTPGGIGRFHVDHDHKTGKIRGLLCCRDNILLGFHKKTIELAQIIGYL